MIETENVRRHVKHPPRKTRVKLRDKLRGNQQEPGQEMGRRLAGWQ